ncbi:hypothetical protein [Atribacter laminatus]|uniref:Uncharacterized protein n=1 Tax=Atribacter laminatus TaxID=2847778 RepID=A0A7T1AKQ6_ATRLM|nr:hypothetical protein [Atribacter laminatus]QPM67731.1 hypothetical protein RT761_00943 [Atribacter laminatus]
MLQKSRIIFLIVSLVAIFTLLLGCTPPSPTPTPTPPDDIDRARDLAIAKANDAGNEVPTNITNWTRQTIPATMPGGTMLVKYSGVSNGNWYIDISYTSGLSLENTDYSVTIQFDGMPAIWTGTITYEELYPIVY